MGKRDPRVDAYIDRAADFAQPILRHLREVVHEASLEIEETMKWRFPHFTCHGVLCSMAAFKAHCAFGFWRDEVLADGAGMRKSGAMGHFGRITSLADLPPRRVLTGYVRKAIKLNQAGTAPPRAAPRPRQVPLPAAFRQALNQYPEARGTFERFSLSQQREYLEWIAGAKRPETEARRIATAIEWISQGKTRNWKYR